MTQIHSEISVSRLTLDIPSHMHRAIKSHASQSNMSIKDYMMKLVEKDFHEIERTQKDFNAKTIRTIRNSIKNHRKLKTFNSVDEMMKDLTSSDKKPSRKKKKI